MLFNMQIPLWFACRHSTHDCTFASSKISRQGISTSHHIANILYPARASYRLKMFRGSKPHEGWLHYNQLHGDSEAKTLWNITSRRHHAHPNPLYSVSHNKKAIERCVSGILMRSSTASIQYSGFRIQNVDLVFFIDVVAT